MYYAWIGRSLVAYAPPEVGRQTNETTAKLFSDRSAVPLSLSLPSLGEELLATASGLFVHFRRLRQGRKKGHSIFFSKIKISRDCDLRAADSVSAKSESVEISGASCKRA